MNWKQLLPSPNDLEAFARLASTDLYVDASNEPSWTKLYLCDKGGKWLSLSWDSQDVAFRFEIFCLSIESNILEGPKRAELAAKIPEFSEVKFLLRTTWLRPASPGEVPSDFVQQLEESGKSSAVPPDYVEAGTTLDGIVFADSSGDPLMVISVVNTTDYLVSVTTEADSMAARLRECDVMPLDKVLSWVPGQR